MRLLLFLLFILACLAAAAPSSGQVVGLSIPDTTVRQGDEILVPVRVDSSLTGRGVTAFRVVLTLSGTAVVPVEVVSEGGLASGMSVSARVAAGEGRIRVAGAVTMPLTGTGVLFWVRVRGVQASRTSSLGFDADESLLNEGTPALIFDGGSITVPSLPRVTLPTAERILLVGETTNYAAAGGRAPYTYSTSDPAVAAIDDAGVLTTLAPGRVTVYAADADGVTSSADGTVDVRGFALSLPDTTVRQGATFEIPVWATSLAGLNVTSGSFEIAYNGRTVAVEALVTQGTLLDGTSPQLSASPPDQVGGRARVAFAASSPLSGDVSVPLVRVRVRAADAVTSTALTLGDVLFNQALRGIGRTGGRVRVVALPTLNLSPASVQVLAGETVALSAPTAVGSVTWTAADPAVAMVDAAGVVTGMGSGTTTVQAVDSDGGRGQATVVVFGARVVVGEGEGRPGETVLVPVRLVSTGELVQSLEARVPPIAGNASLRADSVVSSVDGWLFTTRALRDGTLVVAGAGPPVALGETDLFTLRFPLADDLGDQTRTLVLTDVLLNQGTPTAQVRPGRLTVFSTNRPPTITGSLPGLTLAEDFLARTAADLDTVFADPEGGALTFRISATPDSPFTASLSGATLRLAPVADANGTGAIDVTATDPDGGQTTQRLDVTVDPVNDAPRPPQLTTPEADATLNAVAGSSAPILAAWTAATDVDGDALDYRWQLSLSSDFDAPILDADVASATQYRTTVGALDVLLDGLGVTVGDSVSAFHRVVVRDGVAETASQARAVMLKRASLSVNQPPALATTLPDLALSFAFEPFAVANLDTVFVDPEGDVLTYTLTIEGDAATADLTGSVLTLRSVTGASGAVEVRVTASDPLGAEAATTFEVTVAPASAAPVFAATEEQTAAVGVEFSFEVTASGVPAPVFSVAAAPDGAVVSVVEIEAGRARVSWTPTATGRQAIMLRAENSAGSDEQRVGVWVAEAERQTLAIMSGRVALSAFNDGFVGASYDGRGGFGFDGASALFSGTLLVGASPNQVSGSLYASEFSPLAPIASGGDAALDGFEVVTDTRFSDARAPTPAGVDVSHRIYARDAISNAVVAEYIVINRSGAALAGLHVGLAMDWDVGAGGGVSPPNRASFDADRQLVSTWQPDGQGDAAHYGVALLVRDASGYGLASGDADADTDLWTALTSQTAFPADPTDVRPVVGAGPFDLAPGDSVPVRFVLAAGTDATALGATVDAVAGTLTTTASASQTPGFVTLSEPTPNPARGLTHVIVTAPQPQPARMSVYDAMGREVAVVFDGELQAGAVDLAVDTGALSAGMYLVRLWTPERTWVRSLVVVR